MIFSQRACFYFYIRINQLILLNLKCMKDRGEKRSEKTWMRASILVIPISVTMLFFLACANETIESPSPGDATYAGSAICKTCHTDKYDNWLTSGHSNIFTIIENGQEPVYPAEAVNFQSSWMAELGDGSLDWSDIAGVSGGYGWKARFVGKDGHFIGTANSANFTGMGHNQINFFEGENHGWSDYHTTTETLYNYACFKCHTVGGTTEGSWLNGVDNLGTFSEGGVGCESCHGPGGKHAGAPSKENIDRVYEFAHSDNSLGGLEVNGVIQTPDPEGNDVVFLCGTCHNRDYTNKIDADGGFISNHEQWDEFVVTKHGKGGLTCTSCHDPHKRTVWDGDGITATCTSCHTDKEAHTKHNDYPTCVDCHMPYAGKSGTQIGESGYRADVRSHLMTIIPDTESMFTEDGSAVRDDDTRQAALSPAFSCLACHNDDPDDDIFNITLNFAASYAKGMHATK